ncbi:MAG: hypothetical protein ACREGA_04690 [Candidatus Saccharimonadales bacterium]
MRTGFQQNFKPIIFAASAAVLALAGLASVWRPPAAHAYGLTSQRSITLSDSSPDASNVAYTVQFTPSGATAIGGIVVDFCSNSPDTSQACNPPTNFSVGSAPDVNNYSASMGAGWSAASANNSGTGQRTLILNNNSPLATSNQTPLKFSLNNVNNPSLEATFYARIFTYASSATANNYTNDASGQTPGAFVDKGAVAISTASNVNIGFEVQESLTFCAFTSNANSCSAASGNSVDLGDNHGVLSSAGPFVDKSINYIVATNAVAGAGIYLAGNSLKYNGASLSPVNPPAASAKGTSQFGVCTYTTSGTTLVPVLNYSGKGNGGTTNCSDATISQTAGTGSPGGAGNVNWYLNTAKTNSGYGDEIAYLPGPDTNNKATLALMANTSASQTAGIYQTNLNLIATGSY